MKKRIFALALISLGYIANTQSMGVAIMAEWNKLQKNVYAETTQTVYAKAIWIEEEKPTMPGQPVLELEEIKKDTWLVKHLNPGTAVLHIKKKRSGYSDDHERAHHKCKGALITVKGPKKKKNQKDEDIVVDKNSKKKNKKKEKAMVNVEIDNDNDEGVVIIESDDQE